jgi:hypothetical protein
MINASTSEEVTERSTVRYFFQSGMRRTDRIRDSDDVHASRPKGSITSFVKNGKMEFQVSQLPSRETYVLDMITFNDPIESETAALTVEYICVPFCLLGRPLIEWLNDDHFVINEVLETLQNDSQIFRVGFRRTRTDRGDKEVSGWCELDASNGWALMHCQYRFVKSGRTQEGRIMYKHNTVGSTPFPLQYDFVNTVKMGTTKSSFTFHDTDDARIPISRFSLEAFGLRSIEAPASRSGANGMSYLLWLVSAVTLAIAVVLKRIGFRQG